VDEKEQSLRAGVAREQAREHWALKTLKMVLVYPDECVRDIDTRDVAMVVNCDMPESIDDYVHRICRAGCAGNEGSATSFVTCKTSKIAHDLKNLLAEARQIVPSFLDDIAKDGGWG